MMLRALSALALNTVAAGLAVVAHMFLWPGKWAKEWSVHAATLARRVINQETGAK